jgi:hypothetical protein
MKKMKSIIAPVNGKISNIEKSISAGSLESASKAAIEKDSAVLDKFESEVRMNHDE